MLLDEFDESLDAVVNPSVFYKKVEGFPKTCLSIFSKKIIDELVKRYNGKIIGMLSPKTTETNIYKIEVEGHNIAVFQSPVGAPACVTCFEEIVAMGIENFLLAGCCGCLTPEIEDCAIIIPTSAIRDEGTSYHYLKAEDEIALDRSCVKAIEDRIKSMGLKYHKGKTWTTDALYRETKQKLERRKAQGAITVDMECSAVASVAKFRGVRFGQIFYAADNLGNEDYDPRSLANNNNLALELKIIDIAVACSVALDSKALKS